MKAVCVIGMTNSALKQSKHVINAVTDTLMELGLEVINFNVIECGLPYFEEGMAAESYEKMASFMAGIKNIILAFNVTDYTPSAAMKVFLEHASHGGLFENKNIFIISVDRGTGEKEAADYVSRVVSRHGGVEIVRVALGGSAFRAVNSGAIPIAAVEKYAEDFYRLIKQNRVFLRPGEYIGQAPPYVSKEAPPSSMPPYANEYNPVATELKGLKNHVEGKAQGMLQSPITDQIAQKGKVQDIIAHDTGGGVTSLPVEKAEKKESLLDFDIFNARQEEDIEELTKLFATKLKGDDDGLADGRQGYNDWGQKDGGAASYGSAGAPRKGGGFSQEADRGAVGGAIPSFQEYQAGATFKDNYDASPEHRRSGDTAYNNGAVYSQDGRNQQQYTNAPTPYEQPRGYGDTQNGAMQQEYRNPYNPQQAQGYPGAPVPPQNWNVNDPYDRAAYGHTGERGDYPQGRNEPHGQPRPQPGDGAQGYNGFDGRANAYGVGAEVNDGYGYGAVNDDGRRGLYKESVEPRQLWQTGTKTAAMYNDEAPPYDAYAGGREAPAAKLTAQERHKESERVTARAKTCKQMTQNLVHYFQPQIAQDTEAVFQFNITGEEQFSGYLVIKNKDNEFYEGLYEGADITILADAGIWTNVLKGKYTAQKAFMTGQLKVRGNFMLLNRFDQMYKKM